MASDFTVATSPILPLTAGSTGTRVTVTVACWRPVHVDYGNEPTAMNCAEGMVPQLMRSYLDSCGNLEPWQAAGVWCL